MSDKTATTCAVCGFEVRLYDEVFNGTPTKSYKHPFGSGDHPPHRAVVGVRAPADALRHWAGRPVDDDEEHDDALAEPHPEPEVRARPILDAELPQGVRNVVKLAREAGLIVRVRYARGTGSDAQGRPKHRTRREPKFNGAGEPQLTDNGKQAFSIVKLPEFEVHDCVTAWFSTTEGLPLGVAAWHDGNIDQAWLMQPHVHPCTVTELKEVFTSDDDSEREARPE